jgi:hypothetical protein
MDDELNILPISSHMKFIQPVTNNEVTMDFLLLPIKFRSWNDASSQDSGCFNLVNLIPCWPAVHLGFWGIVRKGARVERPKRSVPWRLSCWPFDWEVLHDGSGAVYIPLTLSASPFRHKLKTVIPGINWKWIKHLQGKAVINFLDSILDKSLRSTVALLAARGRGKSAALGLAIAGAVAAG